MTDWKEITTNKQMLEGIEKLGFRRPQQVQSECYARVLAGESLIVRAQTGTGKTMAYLMPLFEKYREVARENRILVLVPTHELAMQVKGQAESLANATGIKIRTALAVGDVNINRQIDALKEKPQLIIGTAGRTLELIRKKKIAAHLIGSIVLDEGDRLLDEKNRETTDEVIKCCMRDVQLMLFSATGVGRVEEAFRAWKADAGFIDVSEKAQIPGHIRHWFVVVDGRYKLENLRGLVKAIRTKKAMIFINKPSEIEDAADKLQFHNYSVDYIHGERTKDDRKNAINAFKRGKVKYLLATDIAARGLHFDSIDTVFHVSMPEKPEVYLHRAGRTGRNGAPGRNICIISEKERPLIHKYEKALGITFEEMEYNFGKMTKKGMEGNVKQKK